MSNASPRLLCELIQAFANAPLSVAAYGARDGARDAVRGNRRDSYRRDLDTRVGTLEAARPELLEGSDLTQWLVEHRRWAEAVLTPVVATGYRLEVASRRMGWLVQSLGISGLSMSMVAAMAQASTSRSATSLTTFSTGPLHVLGRPRVDDEVRGGGPVLQIARHGGHRRLTQAAVTARSSAWRPPPPSPGRVAPSSRISSSAA